MDEPTSVTTAAVGWMHLTDVLGSNLLADMLRISVSSLRRYGAGLGRAPDAVVERLRMLTDIVTNLEGGYNAEGIRRWFHRDRVALDGSTPASVLREDWSPAEEGPRRVAALAASVSGPRSRP